MSARPYRGGGADADGAGRRNARRARRPRGHGGAQGSGAGEPAARGGKAGREVRRSRRRRTP